MSEASQRAGAQQRLARAREALLRAEQRAGVRGAGHGELRRTASAAARASAPASASLPEAASLGAWQVLERDLDSGWSGVLALSGSLWLLLALAARRQSTHGWCAVVGGQDVGWCAAAEAGLDLARTLVVPLSGRDARSRATLLPGVVGVLVDGVEVVVLTSTVASGLSHGVRRSVQARARERGVLVLLQEAWDGVRRVQARVTDYDTGGVLHVLGEQSPGVQEMPAGYLVGQEWQVRDPRSGALTSLRLDAQGLCVLEEGTVRGAHEPAAQPRPALTVIEGGAQ
ncbi:MAG: hypothetical protein SO046_01515 [Actinomyces urogenitalis]|uniref:hypothetical protein n=1 Tax=Actinomyces urogenitalis TaxID=103621 RepID=UPI002A808CAD|nr:hypothetical protein [Actinomyces urogenitalis]MDY3677885.1 hypothetical protein [Actinomyces urogenitalis]